MSETVSTPVNTEWDGAPIPMGLWGRDHTSTLLYAEVRAVDHRGVIDYRHMRMDQLDKYHTRLSDGTTISGHSDLDCLEDAVDAGLLSIVGDTVVFTDLGWAFVHGLRRAKAERASTHS
jgi:hypothetical protein